MVLVSVALPFAAFYIGRSVAISRNRSAVAARVPGNPAKSLPLGGTTDKPSALAAAGEADRPSPFDTIDSTADRSTPPSQPVTKARRRIEIPIVASPPSKVQPTIPDAPAVAAGAPLTVLPGIISAASTAPVPHAETVIAYIKPARGSGIRHALRKIIGASDSREGYVPANPVAHPLPRVAASEISESETSVELLAKIDRSGAVAHVKFSEGNSELTDASASALSRWRFEPARQNGAPVESDMLVRFEFRKP
jgi:outer membrane biosynthesis protein TonB